MYRTRYRNPKINIVAIFFALIFISIGESFGQWNDPPSMNQPQDMILLRNAGQQTVNLSGISDNSFGFQVISMDASSSNNNIINESTFIISRNTFSSNATFNFTPTNNRSGLVTITITLTDNDGSTDYDFDVLINNPPSFNITSSHTVNENAGAQSVNNFAFDISDGDDNNGSQNLTFDIEVDDQISGNLTFNQFPSINGNGRLTYTANQNSFGRTRFNVTLSDGQAGNNESTTRTFTIIVNEVINVPPTFSLSGNVNVNEDFGGTRSVTVTPDAVPGNEQNQDVTYSINPTSVNFANIDFNSSNGRVNITSIPNRFGNQTFTITADDGQPANNTHSENFSLNVNPVNDPPTMDDINNLTIAEGAGVQEVILTGITGGPFENQQVTSITASSFNENIIPDPVVNYNSNQSQATLRFTPHPNASGQTTIQIILVDAGGETLTKSFTVTINSQNDPPRFDRITTPIRINEDAGEQIIQITGIDAGPGESQALTFSVTSNNTDLIDNAVIEYTSPNPTANLKFSPKTNANGNARLTVRLTDNGPSNGSNQNTKSQNVQVNVAPVNDAPNISSVAVKNAIAGTKYTYEIKAGDVDAGDKLSFTAVNKPGWLNLVDNNDRTATLSGTPTFQHVGNHNINIQVQDEAGAKDNQTFTINVLNENNLPEFTSNPVENATERVFYEYRVSVNDEDENDEITITAPTKPGWLTLSENGARAAILSGTPPEGSMGNHNVVLRATDSRGEFVQQPFTINVSPYNGEPRVRNIQLVIQEDDTITYTADQFRTNFIDGEGDPIAHIIIVSLPEKGRLVLGNTELTAGSTIDPNEISSLKYIPNANVSGFDSFNWNASDGENYAINDALVSITINPVADPPVLSNLETNELTFPFDSDSVVLTNNIQVMEVDNGRLERATITLSGYLPGIDTLIVTNQGNTISRFTIKGENGEFFGELIIEGIDSVHVYQEVLRSAVYYNKNTLATGSLLPRTVTFRVRDNEQFSNELTRMINFEGDFVELDIPNGFTPNEDFQNDTWNIQNIELYPDVHVQVYARNGKKVFESIGYQNEWDGFTDGGYELPSGVYYYFINLNKYQATYEGTITILK